MNKIATFVTRYPKIIIAAVVLINIAALGSFFRFSLDTDFLNFFPDDDPEVAAYHQLNEKYGSGEAVTVLIQDDGSLLGQSALETVFRLQQAIEGTDGIFQVQGFIPAQVEIDGQPVPITPAAIQQYGPAIAQFIDSRYFMTGQFLSVNRTTGILVAGLEPGIDSGPVVAELREIIDTFPELSLSLAGNPVIKDTIVGYLVTILFILLPFAVGLIMAVFYFVLRHRRLTPLAMVPAGIGALWTFGTIFYGGYELSLVTVISPIFIIVMGSAYGLHFVSHFQEKLAVSGDTVAAVRDTLNMVGVPIVLATLTTMVGFGSLMFGDAVPMRQMGMFVTAGIGYAGLLSILFLPAVLSHQRLSARPAPAGARSISGLVIGASRRRGLVTAGFLILAVAAVVYIPQLEVVSNQLMFFKESSEIRRASAVIEEQFGSPQPLFGEMIPTVGTGALYDSAEAGRLLAVERELESLPGIMSVTSIFDLVAGFSQMTTGSDGYPDNPQIVQGLLNQLGEGSASWVAPDGYRLFIRPVDIQPDEIEKVIQWAVDEPAVRVITGMPVLFDQFNQIVVDSQVRSLGWALGLVFVMLLITLRSLKAAMVGLLPIVLTIGTVLTFLVISGFQLNVLTANLSAIVIGVGVDYSIHLISGIYYFRRQGKAGSEAVEAAMSTVSRPVLANAYGLSIGLSVLLFSPLLIHIQASAVMWVAMVISSSAALLIIPQFYRGSRKSAGQIET